MNSTFLKELYEDTEGFEALTERFEALDLDMQIVLEKDSLKEDIVRIMDSLSLSKDYYEVIAQNVAFLLLHVMRPIDLREELAKDMPDVRKDIIDALEQKIKNSLVSKQIMDLISQNWTVDDKEAEEIAEEIEMSLVPLPKDVTSRLEKIDQTQNLGEIRPINTSLDTPESVPLPALKIDIEEKIKGANPLNIVKAENRTVTSRTIPKIGLSRSDQYREIPE